jgi:imidazolonepropionase-like amidohydrolase
LCGSLFEPRTGTVRTNQVITIVDGLVANVSAYDRAASAAASALYVDLSDRFCLPGLVDAHTHLFLRPYNIVAWNDQARPVPRPRLVAGRPVCVCMCMYACRVC